MENLGVRERVVAINTELTGDKHNDVAALSRSGLGIDIGDLVLDLAKGKVDELLDNGLGTLELSTSEGQHRVVSVEVTELSSISVEGLVVELTELLGERVEIDCVRRRKGGQGATQTGQRGGKPMCRVRQTRLKRFWASATHQTLLCFVMWSGCVNVVIGNLNYFGHTGCECVFSHVHQLAPHSQYLRLWAVQPNRE